MMKFDIAGILISVEADDEGEYKRLKSFYSNSCRAADIIVDIFGCEEIKDSTGNSSANEGIRWERGSKDGKNISLYLYKHNSDEVAFKLDTHENWDCAHLYYNKKYFDGKYAFTGPVGEILFRNRILFHSGIVIHASAIEWNGRGIIFTAPSGTGKSTQANLWKKYKKAKVLNGDRPAIRVIEHQPYVYGTPWSGSSPEFVNAAVPLFAVIILEQSKDNKIYRLSKEEALLRLMPRCFLPYYHENLMNLALNNLEEIIVTTPVYLLSCRPDREAVELVYECLKSSL